MLAHLNPFGKGRLPRRKDFWLRTRISVFSFWVRRLQHLYRRYAYYDSINLGTVRITHSCRDEIFEGWLKALGQDVRPHMTTDGIWEKEEGSKSGFRPFYRFFEFKRQLLVNYRGKELLIDRSSQLTVDNEINGLFSISDNTDILLRTSFRSSIRQQSEATTKKAVEVDDTPQTDINKNPKRREKVSLGKPAINIVPPATAPPSKGATSKKMRGVEVDESF